MIAILCVLILIALFTLVECLIQWREASLAQTRYRLQQEAHEAWMAAKYPPTGTPETELEMMAKERWQD